MAKHVTNKKILLLFFLVSILNIIAELCYFLIVNEKVRFSDLIGSLIFLPVNVLLGSVVDKQLFDSIAIFYYISVCFYPSLVLLMWFKNFIYTKLSYLYYVVLCFLFLFATFAPIHRFWALMSV